MDILKHLIIINNDSLFEDKTAEVSSCESRNGYYSIKYENNEKYYKYSKAKVVYLQNPKMVDVNDKDIFIKNSYQPNIISLLQFEKYYKIFYKNNTTSYCKESELAIKKASYEAIKTKDCFEYLKEISNYRIIKNENTDENNYDFEEESLLRKQYDEIGCINGESFLDSYLNNKAITKQKWNRQIIFPFGFNISQKKAVECALEHNASIIDGPPGTGKTQTILNIICNAILANKTVAVVSNNNSATQNIEDKLNKYGLGFISAFLGNSKNIESFFSSSKQDDLSLDNWIIDNREYVSILKDIKQLEQKLNVLLESKNKLAQLKQLESEFLTEQKYFLDYYNSCDINLDKKIFKFNGKKVSELISDLSLIISQGKLKKLWTRVKFLIKYRIFRFSTITNSPDVTLNALKKMFYELKIKEIKKEIFEIEEVLSNNNFEKIKNDYSKQSMIILKSRIAERIKKKPKYSFNIRNYKSNYYEFTKQFPVILSTTHSLRKCKEEKYLFDYVIIDEASQVDIVTAALALSCGKNTVIVGDLKQLPNIITSEDKEIFNEIYKKYNIPSYYNYVAHSILSSFYILFEDGIPRTLLKEHYRCHPKIIGFCNQKFYNNQLVILTEGNYDDNVLAIYRTVPGNHQRAIKKSQYNQREIDVILKEVLRSEYINDDSDLEIGIISPYRGQTNMIKEAIPTENDNIIADTVHKFQGRERDVMIISTVVNKLNGFVDDPNLINVAVSRAVSKLIIVTSKNSFKQHGTNIGDLLRYIKYYSRDEDIVDSKVISIFDLLYTEHSNNLKKILGNMKHVSKYESENLMNVVIEKILSKDENLCFKHVLHIPLKTIIKPSDLFSDEENIYLNNALTHVDFLIFNKLDRAPVLVIEVDGCAFHENNITQERRDALKDSILQKSGLSLLRIKTNESNIKELLSKIISEKLSVIRN